MFNKLVTSGQSKVCCFLKVQRSRLLWPPVSQSDIILAKLAELAGKNPWRLLHGGSAAKKAVACEQALFSRFFHPFPKQRACSQVKKAVTWARGRCTPLYKPYRYVPTQRVGLLRRFGLGNGYTLCHFGLEFVMVSRELWECTNAFIVSIPKWVRKKGKYVMMA